MELFVVFTCFSLLSKAPEVWFVSTIFWTQFESVLSLFLVEYISKQKQLIKNMYSPSCDSKPKYVEEN